MIETKKHAEIEIGKTLKLENVISMRKKMTQVQVQLELEKLMELMKENGVEPKGPMVSTTYNIEEIGGEQILDMEFILPVDKEVHISKECQFKPLFHLVNAVYKQHVGNPEMLQETYNDLMRFMQEHKLQQITSGYNMNVNEEEVALGELPKIDVYIGINPSIL